MLIYIQQCLCQTVGLCSSPDFNKDGANWGKLLKKNRKEREICKSVFVFNIKVIINSLNMKLCNYEIMAAFWNKGNG